MSLSRADVEKDRWRGGAAHEHEDAPALLDDEQAAGGIAGMRDEERARQALERRLQTDCRLRVAGARPSGEPDDGTCHEVAHRAWQASVTPRNDARGWSVHHGSAVLPSAITIRDNDSPGTGKVAGGRGLQRRSIPRGGAR